MSGKNAKSRRIAKRREKKRGGLTEKQYKKFLSLRKMGYGEDTARTAALERS